MLGARICVGCKGRVRRMSDNWSHFALNALGWGDLVETDDPLALFRRWYAEAAEKEINDPDAMSLATVDAEGMPNVRAVLCKQVDERGFVFYTNRESAKGDEIAASPKAAILFHWKSLRRQVRARGPIAKVSDAEFGRLFRHPTVAQPHRRLGQPAVATARIARQARAGRRRLGDQIRHRRHSAPTLLGRLPADAAADRVLAGQLVLI